MRSVALFLLIAVMTSCGAPEAPLAQVAPPSPAPVATTAATLVPVQATVAPQPSAAPQLSTTMLPLVQSTVVTPELALTIALPQPGELLLRDIWPMVTDISPTRYLYYMRSEEVSNGIENSFWRVDVQDMRQTQLASSVAGSGLEQGLLSPDGAWIAYQVDTGENSADLFVMPAEGGSPIFIAGNVGSVAEGCDSYLAWSPDSQQIAFNRYDSTSPTPGWSLEVTRLDQPISTQPILSAPLLKLIGWTGVNRLLTYSGDYGQMPLIQEFDIQQKTHRILQEFPRRTGTYCSKFSSERAHALLNLSTGNWLLDTTSGQMQPVAVRNGGRTTWSPRDIALIELPSTSPQQPIVVLRETLTSTQTVRMLPEGLPGSNDVDHWGISSAAPDGRFIAACQLVAMPEGAYLRRLALYDIVQHRWSIVSNGCGFVLGWRSA